MSVVKKDGSRVPWDRNKIFIGLERACYKRPIQAADLQRVVDEVEEEIFKTYDKEVPSVEIGGLVTERLRHIDQVAYVRFASVYRQFKTLDELVAEAKAVIDAQRYESPGQGRLFIEPKRPGPNGSKGAQDTEERPKRRAKAVRVPEESGGGEAVLND